MPHFTSWRDYHDFENDIKLGRDTREFLDAVLYTAKKRTKLIPKGTELWRAQRGRIIRTYDKKACDQEGTNYIIPHTEEIPYPAERMKPPKDNGKEGRINPKGTAYLYLAAEKETAVAEVRPWVGERVSLGQFAVLQDISLVDCGFTPGSYTAYRNSPSSEESEQIVWDNINMAFSTPAVDREEAGTYVPTQAIADLFKQNNYDGIIYKSAMNKGGHNIALFNIDLANLISCNLCCINEIKCTASDIAQLHEFVNPVAFRAGEILFLSEPHPTDKEKSCVEIIYIPNGNENALAKLLFSGTLLDSALKEASEANDLDEMTLILQGQRF